MLPPTPKKEKAGPLSATATAATMTPQEKERHRQQAGILVTTLVDTEYDQASAEFRLRGSADAWRRLITAMYALQYWRGLSPERKLDVAMEVVKEPIGKWIHTLRAMAEDEHD